MIGLSFVAAKTPGNADAKRMLTIQNAGLSGARSGVAVEIIALTAKSINPIHPRRRVGTISAIHLAKWPIRKKTRILGGNV